LELHNTIEKMVWASFLVEEGGQTSLFDDAWDYITWCLYGLDLSESFRSDHIDIYRFVAGKSLVFYLFVIFTRCDYVGHGLVATNLDDLLYHLLFFVFFSDKTGWHININNDTMEIVPDDPPLWATYLYQNLDQESERAGG
jgi:hypothetical protein